MPLELPRGPLLTGRLAHVPVARLRVVHLHQQTVVTPAQIITGHDASGFHA